jgi:hypothetical protein
VGRPSLWFSKTEGESQAQFDILISFLHLFHPSASQPFLYQVNITIILLKAFSILGILELEKPSILV